LTTEEMARVEAAMQQEEQQYLEALARKLTAMARAIKPS